jgi:hypothetical protein
MGAAQQKRPKRQRTLRRCCEASRLEEDLWKLVFEELWPLASRSTRRKRTPETGDGLDRQTKQTRGA